MILRTAFISLALSLSATAQSAPLVAEFKGKNYSASTEPAYELHRAQQAIGQYLEVNLGCKQVQLCLSEYSKSTWGFFQNKPGKLALKLTASCPQSVENLKFDLRILADHEDYSDVLMSYKARGKNITVNIATRNTTDDRRQGRDIIQKNGCDSSPIDRRLPLHIIDDPQDIRTEFMD